MLEPNLEQHLVDFQAAHVAAAEAERQEELAILASTQARLTASEAIRWDARARGEKVTEAYVAEHINADQAVRDAELAVIAAHHARRLATGRLEVFRERSRFLRLSIQQATFHASLEVDDGDEA